MSPLPGSSSWWQKLLFCSDPLSTQCPLTPPVGASESQIMSPPFEASGKLETQLVFLSDQFWLFLSEKIFSLLFSSSLSLIVMEPLRNKGLLPSLPKS